MKIKILVPVYNDFESLSKLLNNINSVISNLTQEFSVIVVNDASTDKAEIDVSTLNNIKSIKMINMKENRGHARCNAAGMKYIFENGGRNYLLDKFGLSKSDIIDASKKIK